MTFLRKLGVLRVDRDHSHTFLACSPTVLTLWVELHAVSQNFWHTFLLLRKSGQLGQLSTDYSWKSGCSPEAAPQIWLGGDEYQELQVDTYFLASTILHVEGTCPEKNCRALGSVSATMLLQDRSLAFLWKPDDLFLKTDMLQCPLRGQHLQASKT